MSGIRLLQTSDVHLRSDRPERRRALEFVFAAAHERRADAILVAGDLFDRPGDAIGERRHVRDLVEAFAPRPVVFVPGNHDGEAYGPGTELGANAVVLTARPWSREIVCGIEIIGLPYQHGRTVAECLAGIGGTSDHRILLGHATVADGIAGAFAGEGEDGAYMPVASSELLRRFSYSALGHIHSGRNLQRESGGRLVAYAGSPVATSRRELGPRRALEVEFEPRTGVVARVPIPLPVPYFERTEAACVPGREDDAIERLARQAVALRRPRVQVLARLTGVSTASESELRERATAALERAWRETPPGTAPDEPRAAEAPGPAPILELQATSYEALARTPIVADFVDRLGRCVAAEAPGDDRLLEEALRIGLGAFLESLP